MEIINVCLEVNEPIKLNYEDPFLSNEAKNSLLEKDKKGKVDNIVPSGNHADRSIEQSVRYDIKEY